MGDTFLIKNEGLRTFTDQRPWFDDFLRILVANKPRPRATVSVGLEDLEIRDAQMIARSLPIAILTNIDGQAAVVEWISNYPALRELEEKEAANMPRPRATFSVSLKDLEIRDSQMIAKSLPIAKKSNIRSGAVDVCQYQNPGVAYRCLLRQAGVRRVPHRN